MGLVWAALHPANLLRCVYCGAGWVGTWGARQLSHAPRHRAADRLPCLRPPSRFLACRFLSPEPPFWTNATSVTFSFSDFDSPSNSGPMQYRWAISSTRWGRDVLDWVPFEGFSSMQAVQVRLFVWVGGMFVCFGG